MLWPFLKISWHRIHALNTMPLTPSKIVSVNMKLLWLLVAILAIPNLLALESDDDIGSFRSVSSSESDDDTDDQQPSQGNLDLDVFQEGKLYIKFLSGLF